MKHAHGLLRLRPALEDRIDRFAPARLLRFALAMQAIERFASGEPVRILDAGCGDGLLSVELARRHPTWAVVGADLRSDLLGRARRRAAAAAVGNVQFVHTDLTADLGEQVYDVVAAIECFEEIPDDDLALERIARALRPGGLLVVHVPERNWKPVLAGSAAVWREEVRHGYAADELAGRIAAAGLRVTSVERTSRSLVRLAEELRDRIRTRHLSVRAAAYPVLALMVQLERRGVTCGRERALLALARRDTAAPR